MWKWYWKGSSKNSVVFDSHIKQHCSYAKFTSKMKSDQKHLKWYFAISSVFDQISEGHHWNSSNHICWIDHNLQNSVAETFLWICKVVDLSQGLSFPLALVLVGIMNICKNLHWGLVNVINNWILLFACQCQIIWNVKMLLMIHNKNIQNMLSIVLDIGAN